MIRQLQHIRWRLIIELQIAHHRNLLRTQFIQTLRIGPVCAAMAVSRRKAPLASCAKRAYPCADFSDMRAFEQ